MLCGLLPLGTLPTLFFAVLTSWLLSACLSQLPLPDSWLLLHISSRVEQSPQASLHISRILVYPPAWCRALTRPRFPVLPAQFLCLPTAQTGFVCFFKIQNNNSVLGGMFSSLLSANFSMVPDIFSRFYHLPRGFLLPSP